MSKTYYVVTETNFEYNDEYHSVVDGGGGNPVAVFENEEDAKKETAKRNIDAARQYGVEMIAGFLHGYGFDGTFDPAPSFLDDDVDYNYDNIHEAIDIKNRTNDELAELVTCLRIKFFTYTKV